MSHDRKQQAVISGEQGCQIRSATTVRLASDIREYLTRVEYGGKIDHLDSLLPPPDCVYDIRHAFWFAYDVNNNTTILVYLACFVVDRSAGQQSHYTAKSTEQSIQHRNPYVILYRLYR